MKQQNIIRIDDWQPGAALGCHQGLILCAQISIIRNINALNVSDDPIHESSNQVIPPI